MDAEWKEIEAKMSKVHAEEGLVSLRALCLKGAQPTIDEAKLVVGTSPHHSASVFPENMQRLRDHVNFNSKGDLASTIATLKSIPNQSVAAKQLLFIDSWGKVTKAFAALKLSVLQPERKDRAIAAERAKFATTFRMYAEVVQGVLGSHDDHGPPLSELFTDREG
eukprot:4371525-Pyramimonas_sp.AAC.1